MPFQPGNKAAVGGRKEKPWRDALMIALSDHGPDRAALRTIAARCVVDAINGDKDARREIAERLDGKVPQTIGGDEGNPLELIHKIERAIVRPENQDG